MQKSWQLNACKNSVHMKMLCYSIDDVLRQQGITWEPEQADLKPVLAVGSNAAPAQLARKFPLRLFPAGVTIPVLRCVLPDFDVVYAPLISSYGSCTGQPSHTNRSPMCQLRLVTTVTPALLCPRAKPPPPPPLPQGCWWCISMTVTGWFQHTGTDSSMTLSLFVHSHQ